MAAKSEFEISQEFAQQAISVTPVIILGSGASAAHGVPGMGALAGHLTSAQTPSDWTPAELAEWSSLLSKLDAGIDLETALQAVRCTDRQTHFIARETRQFLLPSDLSALDALLGNRHHLPLTRLYRHLFDSTHKTIEVITPNYDRLAEYAADVADAYTFTGFNYGHIQTWARSPNIRVTSDGRQLRTVAIWKVHGSFDWFQDSANQIVGLRSSLPPPSAYTPLMITPGIEKYRLAYGEPFRTIIACGDKAIENARSFLCVGYGFNDEHLQTKLVERCDRDSIPLIVLTKELTPAAKSFLSGGRCRRYLAIEDGSSGARAYTHKTPAGFDIDQPLWRLDRFLDSVIGKSV